MNKFYWNPWHGCKKVSEGCLNCYMYTADKQYGKDPSLVYKTSKFDDPIKTDRYNNYKISAGTIIYVCLNSDFFCEEADDWREDAWEIIKERYDCIFIIITKHAERIQQALPEDWSFNNYKHVNISVTTENQKRADERLPMFLKTDVFDKGITIAPMLEKITISKYLATGKINIVTISGEEDEHSRPLDYAWVLAIREECIKYNVSFIFFKTGDKFIKSGKVYNIAGNNQYTQAEKANINYYKKY